MFDIGWGELVVIGVVALIVIGPKELPGLLRTFGQGMTKLRAMAADFQGQFNDAMREVELDDLRKQAEKLTDMTSGVTDPIAKIGDDLQKAIDQPVETIAADAPSPLAAATPVEVAQKPAEESAPELPKPVEGGGRGA
jgi:sec-independent protein translocase protein TatB